MYKDIFVKYLQYEKRYSTFTLRSYTSDLEQFFEFCEQSDKDFSPLTTDHKIIRQWVVYLMENNLTPRSVNRKITTLKTFYKFLMREGLLEVNPLDRVLSPKTSKKLPVFVEENHINQLIDEIDFSDDFEGVRDKLILELFYVTGIRLSELISIRCLDLDLNNLSIKVLGKRNKERIIPLSRNVKNIVCQYLDSRSETFSNLEGDYLFLTAKGEKMYPKLVYRIVNKYLQLVTTIDKKSPHVLRHTFATHMLNNGADLNAIKELLGHANLSATQVYTHNTFEKLKKIYKQAHPRA